MGTQGWCYPFFSLSCSEKVKIRVYSPKGHPRKTKKFWDILFSENMHTKFHENRFSGSGAIHMFVVDRQTNRQMNHYHMLVGETFFTV